MKIIVLFVVVVNSLQGALAGRAFPVAAENYAVRLFQTINPYLEWDPTNFLVDLSGRFALCKNVGRRGSIDVEYRTPEDDSIGGLIDFASGHETNAPAVTKYIEATLPSWVREPEFSKQIERAEKVGCSVQPGCPGGQVAISCLFSPEMSGEGPPPLKQIAQAFTYHQYLEAERITNADWDRSFELENLSGYETGCAMVHQSTWPFNKAKKMVDFHIEGLFGKALNRGSTPEALTEILRSFNKLPAKNVGCSLIPDCMEDGRMWVVVSCIFSDKV